MDDVDFKTPPQTPAETAPPEPDDAVQRLQPPQRASQASAERLYGASEKVSEAPSPIDEPPVASFLESCKRHCKAALYDLMHYDALLPDRLASEGCRTRAGYVVSRGGRLPYLLFTLLSLLVVFYILWSCLRK